jgi:hypothetical protein
MNLRAAKRSFHWHYWARLLALYPTVRKAASVAGVSRTHAHRFLKELGLYFTGPRGLL